MTYANPVQRHELVTGLRTLADFLETNPEVPAPLFTDVLVFPPSVSDTEQRQEIDVIASRIGSETDASSAHRHYTTSRMFGPVEYRAVAIPTDKPHQHVPGKK